MKTLKLLLATGVLSASCVLLSSFTDSTYQRNQPQNPSMQPQDSSNKAWYQADNNDSLGCDRFELNIFDQNDEHTLYNKYGYSRGDLHHIFKYTYDVNTVQTFRGNVNKVMRVRYPDGDCYVVVLLNTDSGDYLVNLGPVWFIDENGLVVNEGDSLQVRGSKVRMNGRYLIITSEIKKDGEILKFRDMQGTPSWGTHPNLGTPQEGIMLKKSWQSPSSPNPALQQQMNKVPVPSTPSNQGY